MAKRNYKVGAWYLELPKVISNFIGEEIPKESRMSGGRMAKYNDCTYDVSRRYDPLRAKDKITIKFYDNRGFIVWKEEYYAN